MVAGAPQPFKVSTGFKFAVAGSGPGGPRIETRIGIQAPVETVWELVYDVAAWSAWNPLHPQAEGRIRIGEVLNLTQALPGRPPRAIQPRVIEWVPNEQLHWRLTRMRGLAVFTRYIEIEKLGEVGCIVTSGELIGGPLGPSLARPDSRALRRGLNDMNEALKTAAEAAWARTGA